MPRPAIRWTPWQSLKAEPLRASPLLRCYCWSMVYIDWFKIFYNVYMYVYYIYNIQWGLNHWIIKGSLVRKLSSYGRWLWLAFTPSCQPHHHANHPSSSSWKAQQFGSGWIDGWKHSGARNPVFFPECVARVPVSLWGSGGWGCVRSTLRLWSQPFATVRARTIWPCLW